MAITCTLLSAAVYGDFVNLGCDPGWTDLGNGYCYQVVTSKAVSRKNANYDCGTTFSALVTVSNVGEMVRAIENGICLHSAYFEYMYISLLS